MTVAMAMAETVAGGAVQWESSVSPLPVVGFAITESNSLRSNANSVYCNAFFFFFPQIRKICLAVLLTVQ